MMNLTQQDVARIVQDELKKQQRTDMFSVAKVPFHTHNGIDSPPLRGSTTGTVYYGFVNNSTSAGTPFPEGWSVVNNGTGDCTITHNLGTTEYVVLATSEGTASIMSPQTRNTNTISIFSYSTAGTSQSTDFFFAVYV